MVLAHHIVKGAGPPFAVQGLIQDITVKSLSLEPVRKYVGAEQGRTPAFEAYDYARYPDSRLKNGNPAAHAAVPLSAARFPA